MNKIKFVYKGNLQHKLFSISIVSLFLLSSYISSYIPELITKQLLGGRVSIGIPKEFSLMTKEMVRNKYPLKANRPLEVYSNSNGSITIVFDHTNDKATPAELPAFKKVFEAQFAGIREVDFRRSELKNINGRDFIVLEMVTPVPEGKIYNLMFITTLDNRLLLGNFNCPVEFQKEWQPISQQIMNSVIVK